ncbi:hypothetical protein D6C83_01365 [Aureobasidium pullulans]|uniref:Uncharacterized protein n=1 Tax=Aureobasidium pullulans TaxID=5580 RepID=A0A4T0E6Q0_AURPU|nr:hypothetical protein D6C83_01365 [Aureobasidium pullulans]
MDKPDLKLDTSVDDALLLTIKRAVVMKLKDVVSHLVYEMAQNDPEIHAIEQNINAMLSDAVHIEVETRVKKRLENAASPAAAEHALRAQLEMAKNTFATKEKVIEQLQAHIDRRAMYFQTFDGLLESACADGGEDGLGAGGPLTNLLNFAHDLNDKDIEVFEQAVEDLQQGLVTNDSITKMQDELDEMIVKEDGAIKEGALE